MYMHSLYSCNLVSKFELAKYSNYNSLPLLRPPFCNEKWPYKKGDLS